MNEIDNINTVPDAILKLIQEFSKLPGIGKKTAQRLTYHLVRTNLEDALSLSESIMTVKNNIILCSECSNITQIDPCNICNNPIRDKTRICIVEEALDVLALERTGIFNGLYHVLHGVISPVNGVGPDDINIKKLIERIDSGNFSEIILAMNPNLEGEATSMYINQLLTGKNIDITRPARGIPIGSDIEYADEVTLGQAITGRQKF
ncbi:MAG: recombination protein RecR [Chloroflexi bacterium]|nr:recombination protein RecR [Chloroflexota bacterium]MCH2304755.1 recombination mediator RecR [SAR202 cluster bacterium]|tara:strand:+ start:815 stop:1432 length:618 start_codon:yes stop_codon:yes gene_type:complete